MGSTLTEYVALFGWWVFQSYVGDLDAPSCVFIPWSLCFPLYKNSLKSHSLNSPHTPSLALALALALAVSGICSFGFFGPWRGKWEKGRGQHWYTSWRSPCASPPLASPSPPNAAGAPYVHVVPSSPPASLSSLSLRSWIEC
ncbi:hypothetical protein BHM03_00050412 [Ensete ventricosum]|nr:hypothetical protein BHM03_00050412 [Ensete ventricosum]